ncbi:T9SS type B sorting domain-containing protein [Flavobacterium sp. CYK-4]|uniref:gliding motility-associated C-terminal domain-containing protein n=1 Tax=Flavobacterium lotistagni TaxID=2709660 RepID=UPI00140CF129|nr:gliding motility-associated C-terminal domain-containing protein [Flavobacterium lotistagni]NHM07487.1 T9SS type B sorting domain-containing protein [Flavobacterium lotistagni]
MRPIKHQYNQLHCIHWLAMGIIFFCVVTAQAQVRVPYQVRTSQYSSTKKVYSLHGDFTFIGNTNLTLLNYEPQTNNNNSLMRYVDIDNDTATWNSSSADLVFAPENNASATCASIVYAGLYWTGKSAPDNSTDSSNEFTVSKIINGTTTTKTFNKRKIKLKGPNASNYSEFIAREDAIYYPNHSDAFIYSAYTEVTDYVRQHGIGTYLAADIALVEGNGGGTGYSGGWGMVVIYENAQMKHRDISVFDGHAFVLNSNNNGYLLEVNGFHTVQSGNVGAKLGIMASEGDIGLDGDYFQIQRNSDSEFVALEHEGNSADNFFNSSISNGNVLRNPNLSNNTGIDLALFDIPNPANSVIGNHQSSVRFRYGTNYDTYAIFAIVLAVDSYVPEIENEISVTQINQLPFAALTALPGNEINFKVTIKNPGNEPINNYKIAIPLPYNASYVASSATGNLLYNGPAPTEIGFDASLGNNGTIYWNFGTLPVASSSATVLATLEFKLRATDNCSILKQPDCANVVILDGYACGTGAISGIDLPNSPFILGHSTAGSCAGNPILGPLKIIINATDFLNSHCQYTASIRNFTFCNTNNTVDFSQIARQFPEGTFFYNSYPVTQSTVQYSTQIPFEAITGESVTYYAVNQNQDGACIIPFTITKCMTISAHHDQGNTINGNLGGVAVQNVLSNDFLNGHTALATAVTTSLVGVSPLGISLNGNQVLVAAGTPSGNYQLTYQICAVNEPNICATATISVSVNTTEIIAENDQYQRDCSTTGILGNVLSNDTLNGNSVLASQVTISLEVSSDPKILLNTQTGQISIAAGIKAGRYRLRYKISTNGNLNISDSAEVVIDIIDQTAPPVPLLNDIIRYCEANLTVPTTTDECSGTILATTSDSLYYDQPGNYIVHWNFIDESGNQSSAQQNVTVKSSEAIEPGFGYVDCNLDNDFSLNIDLNSYLPEGMDHNGSWSSESLTPNLHGSVFSPYLAPTGNYNFKYFNLQGDCRQNIEVNIEVNNDCLVEPACSLIVNNAFSPNNDGINDTFIIGNIDQTYCFPKNTVEIYNRWGVLVFKTQQYDNNTRVFKGYSQGRTTINESEQLPSGTYFYVINYTNDKGEDLEQNGYLYLAL